MTTVAVRRSPGRQRLRAVLGPAPFPWGVVTVLAVLLAAADGFVLVAVQGAVGAIERSQGPFVSWLEFSALSLPVFYAAVLGALLFARRRMGADLRSARKVVAGALLVAAAATVVGTAELGLSAAADYRLQAALLQVQHADHATEDGGPGRHLDPASATRASLETDLLGVRYGAGIDLAANVVLVGWLVALRGGTLDAAPRRRRADRAPDALGSR
ncbi:hypothetical protein [Geodermatophilus sp. SYSU D00815]